MEFGKHSDLGALARGSVNYEGSHRTDQIPLGRLVLFVGHEGWYKPENNEIEERENNNPHER